MKLILVTGGKPEIFGFVTVMVNFDVPLVEIDGGENCFVAVSGA